MVLSESESLVIITQREFDAERYIHDPGGVSQHSMKSQ